MAHEQTVQMSPKNPAVKAAVFAALRHGDENNPAQLFADMVMAANIMAELTDVDISNVAHMFEVSKPNAVVAATYIEKQVTEELLN